MTIKIEDNVEVPAITRSGGGGASAYPFADMTANQSFLLAVAVPEAITDAGERVLAFNDEANKIKNRLSGATRRFRKGAPAAQFAIRRLGDGTDAKKDGVRVWRLVDLTPAELKKAQDANAAANNPAPPAPPAK